MGYVKFMGGPLHGTELWMKAFDPEYHHLFNPPEKITDPPLPYGYIKTAVYKFMPCKEDGFMIYYYVFEEIYDGRV